MPISVAKSVGVVLAREEIDHPWQDHIWRPIRLIIDALPVNEWKETQRGPGWVHYHAATVPLELFRKETSAYQVNLQNREPVIYVVLRDNEDEEADYPIKVHLVTASPFEAQDYLDSGEDLVETIDMPDEIMVWLEGFVEEHHVEEKFYKRKNDRINVDEHKFGQEPIFVTRERMVRRNGND